jgi:hypothetical protein
VVPIPTLPGARAAVVAVETDRDLRVYAAGLGDSDAPFDVPSESGAVRITALLYRSTLTDLELTRGPLEPAAPGILATRPLPPLSPGEAAYVLTPPSFRNWAETATLSAAVAGFLLPSDTPEQCMARQGCYDHQVQGLCVPCPEPPPVAPPSFADLPDPPVLTPCPAGWNLTTISSSNAVNRTISVCQPYAGGRPNCGLGSYAPPGSSSCALVSGPCPAGLWADGLPSSKVIYASAGASGGDGSMGAPFGTLKAALQAAAPGDTIALSRTDFAESATITVPVSLIGACAETRVGIPGFGSLTVSSSSVTIRTLRLEGPLHVHGSLALDRIEVVGPSNTSVAVVQVAPGGSLSGAHVAISPNGAGGVFVDGGSADLSTVAIVQSSTTALRASAGARVTLRSALIADSSRRSVNVLGRASARFSEVAVLGYLKQGLVVTEGSTVAVDAGVFSGAIFGPDIFVASSSLTASRLWIAPGPNHGIESVGAARVSAHDIVIRARTSTGSDGARFATGSISVARWWIAGTEGGIAFGVNGRTLDAEATDILVAGAAADGLHHSGGNVRVNRIRLEDCYGFGVYSSGDTLSGELGLAISSMRIERCQAGGVRLLGSRQISIDHAALVGNFNAGIAVGDALRPATVVASELSIDGFKASTCLNNPCPQGGVVAFLNGTFHGSRFAIQHAAGVPAIDVSGGGMLTLADGLVANDPIALKVGTASFDLKNVLLRVLYRDDGTLVDRAP